MAKKILGADMVGRSGLEGVRSGFLLDEPMPELRGLEGAKRFRQMSENDPVIGGILFAASMLMRGVDWRIKAKDKSAAAIDAEELYHQILFEDMDTPFSDVIEEVLSMLVYGYALMEVVPKRRQGELNQRWLPMSSDVGAWTGIDMLEPPAPSSKFDDDKVGIHQLAIRSQQSIVRWYFDKYHNWVAVQQQIEGEPDVVISRRRLLHFMTTSSRGNPEARSLLRTVYRSVMRKEQHELAEGRLNHRSSGIVLLSIPEEYMAADADDNQRAVFDAYKTLAVNLAKDKQGGAVIPSTRDEKGNALFELKYITSDSRRTTDMGGTIERYDKRIASSVLADFILLGQSNVGSFALSSNKTQMFGVAMGGFLKSIATVFNRQLFPKLARLNGIDLEVIPELVPGDIESADLQQVGEFLGSLTKAGAQLFPDVELENHLRAMANVPLKPEDMATLQIDAAKQGLEMAASGKTGPDGKPLPQDDEDPKGEKPNDKAKEEDDEEDE